MFSTLRFPVGLVAATLCLVVACKKEAPPAPAPPPRPAAPAAAPASGRVAVQVTEAGFEPARIPARAGKPLTMAITRKTDRTCAREILFAGQEGKTELPLNKTVEVTYTPKASGEVKFGCAMGMMVGGVLAVSD
jgi:plastocyanin domain-containing protein